MISKDNDTESLDVIRDKIDDLCLMDLLNQDNQLVSKIKEIVPEYISNNSIFEDIDKKRHEVKIMKLRSEEVLKASEMKKISG